MKSIKIMLEERFVYKYCIYHLWGSHLYLFNTLRINSQLRKLKQLMMSYGGVILTVIIL